MLRRIILALAILASLAPGILLAPVLGVEDPILQIVCWAVLLPALSQVRSSTIRIVLSVFPALFFALPPFPNYLWMSPKGPEFHWVGWHNLGSPVPYLIGMAFFWACWGVSAWLVRKKPASR
jgi:hypothetical protein